MQPPPPPTENIVAIDKGDVVGDNNSSDEKVKDPGKKLSAYL